MVERLYNVGEQVAVVALVILDHPVRADERLAGDAVESQLLTSVLLAHALLLGLCLDHCRQVNRRQDA